MSNSTKTWKRETASVMLLYIGWLGITDRVEVLSIVIGPFMLFVLAAFGMDWIGRQSHETIAAITNRNKPK